MRTEADTIDTDKIKMTIQYTNISGTNRLRSYDRTSRLVGLVVASSSNVARESTVKGGLFSFRAASLRNVSSAAYRLFSEGDRSSRSSGRGPCP